MTIVWRGRGRGGRLSRAIKILWMPTRRIECRGLGATILSQSWKPRMTMRCSTLATPALTPCTIRKRAIRPAFRRVRAPRCTVTLIKIRLKHCRVLQVCTKMEAFKIHQAAFRSPKTMISRRKAILCFLSKDDKSIV